MPTAKKDFAASLRRQPQGGGRSEPPPDVRQLRQQGALSPVPGEGGVCLAPGRQNGGRQERSAARFAEPMQRFGGPSTTGE
jgi:hypothetical protein